MGRNFGSGNFSLKIPLKGQNGNVTKNVEIEYVENGFYKIKIKRERKY